MSWASEEMASINLGDKRLNSRLHRLLGDLGDSPSLSIPTACGGWHETKAAYRFFCNPKVSADKILAPHLSMTMQRMQHYPVVLLLQDTTTLDFTGQKERNDIGPINHGKQRGLLFHPTLAVTPERLCLGVIDNYYWAREKVRHRTPNEKSRDNHKIPLQEKESYRWIRGYQKANEVAKELPQTMIVSVADREADIYDLYHEAQNKNHDKTAAYWLIRSRANRRLLNANGRVGNDKLIEKTKQTTPIGTITFEIQGHETQIKRSVTQAIYVTQLTLYPPGCKQKISARFKDKTVTTTAVIATEISAPEGQTPLEWVLVTNVPVNDAKRAEEILQWYLCRWQIEVYFRILKSGCRVEKLQLASHERFSACFTLYLIIAWRILYLTLLGRECPDSRCEVVFSAEEWKMAYRITQKKKPPDSPPALNSMIKMVAKLGGYLDRNSDPYPGPKTIWIGLQRLRDFIVAQQSLVDTGEGTYG